VLYIYIRRLDVPVTLLPYPSPGDLCDDAGKQVWDIGNVGSVPQRAAEIDFSAPYAEIQCTYIVSAGKFRVGDRVRVGVGVLSCGYGYGYGYGF
jgi:hypothetical protein